MTDRIPRSRHDYFVGFWAIAPAVVIPLLLFAWWHRVTTFPDDPGSFDQFDSSFHSLADHFALGVFGGGALYLIALVVVISDVWIRPLEQSVRIMWTILTLFFAPFGGVVYWFVACRSSRV